MQSSDFKPGLENDSPNIFNTEANRFIIIYWTFKTRVPVEFTVQNWNTFKRKGDPIIITWGQQAENGTVLGSEYMVRPPKTTAFSDKQLSPSSYTDPLHITQHVPPIMYLPFSLAKFMVL